jgi:hypothetical protein
MYPLYKIIEFVSWLVLGFKKVLIFIIGNISYLTVSPMSELTIMQSVQQMFVLR